MHRVMNAGTLGQADMHQVPTNADTEGVGTNSFSGDSQHLQAWDRRASRHVLCTEAACNTTRDSSGQGLHNNNKEVMK